VSLEFLMLKVAPVSMPDAMKYARLDARETYPNLVHSDKCGLALRDCTNKNQHTHSSSYIHETAAQGRNWLATLCQKTSY
jgi:hypothetical protein